MERLMEVRVDSDRELWLEAGSADVSPFQKGSHRRSVNDFLPLVTAPPHALCCLCNTNSREHASYIRQDED